MAGNVSHSAGSICFLHRADDGTVHTCNPVLYRRGGCQLSGWEGGLSLLCTPPPCPHSARHTPSRRAMLPWSPAWDGRVDTLVAFIPTVLNTYVGQMVSLLCLPRWAGRSGRFSARSDVRRRLFLHCAITVLLRMAKQTAAHPEDLLVCCVLPYIHGHSRPPATEMKRQAAAVPPPQFLTRIDATSRHTSA